MNPKFGMYGLHNLHAQPIGFQSFIFLLNWESVFEFLISLGTFLHISGPRKEIVSVPYIVVRTF